MLGSKTRDGPGAAAVPCSGLCPFDCVLLICLASVSLTHLGRTHVVGSQGPVRLLRLSPGVLEPQPHPSFQCDKPRGPSAA